MMVRGADEESTDERTAAADGMEIVGGEATMELVREVPVTPGGRQTIEEVEGGASNDLRTVI